MFCGIHTKLSECRFIVVTVNFNHTTYDVDEDDGPAQPVLVLSNPSASDITLHVSVTNGSATGKYVKLH